MQAASAQAFTATLQDSHFTPPLGARIEEPVTRAIIEAFIYATFDGNSNVWTANLTAPTLPTNETSHDYNIVWMTTAPDPNNVLAYVPLHVVTALSSITLFPTTDLTTSGVRPTTDEVSRIMRTRTKDDAGVDHGVFGSTTYPTNTEVDYLISDALQAVLADLPARLDPGLYQQAKWAVTLQTAILVENSYFRVQTGAAQPNTTVAIYTRQLADTLAKLTPTTQQYTGMF